MTIAIVRRRTNGAAAGGLQRSREPLEENPWPWVWNYLVGGKDNFQPQQVFAGALRTALAWDDKLARSRLLARRRVVGQLARLQGVDQFLVLCADLPVPAPGHGPQRLALVDEALAEVHVIAEQADPAARTVYVSPDPVVAVHARALLRTETGAACPVVEAAVGDPVAIVDGASRALDLARPVAVVAIGALELLDDQAAKATLAVFGALLRPGSHLGVVHLMGTPPAAEALKAICAAHRVPAPHLRGPKRVAGLLGRGELTGVHSRDLRGPQDIAVWSALTRIGDGA